MVTSHNSDDDDDTRRQQRLQAAAAVANTDNSNDDNTRRRQQQLHLQLDNGDNKQHDEEVPTSSLCRSTFFDATGRFLPARCVVCPFSTRRGGFYLPVVSFYIFRRNLPVVSFPSFSTQRGGFYLLSQFLLINFVKYLLNIIFLIQIPVGGLANPRVWFKPLPQPVKNPYPWCGYGLTAGRVRVALGNPRVTRDNH